MPERGVDEAITAIAASGVTHSSGVRHSCFFFPSADQALYASLYHRPGAPAATGVVMCQSWGHEALAFQEWTHRVAHDAALGGLPTVIPQWPGTQDSHGDPNDVTLDSLVEAAVDATASSAPFVDVAEWIPVGLRVGASVAALAAHELQSSGLLLVEPALDLDAHFQSLEREARRAALGAPVPDGWAYGHPHPPGLRRSSDTDRVASAVQSFRGDATVIRYRRPSRVAVSGLRTVTIRGDWRTPVRDDHPPLQAATLRWLRRSGRRVA